MCWELCNINKHTKRALCWVCTIYYKPSEEISSVCVWGGTIGACFNCKGLSKYCRQITQSHHDNQLKMGVSRLYIVFMN